VAAPKLTLWDVRVNLPSESFGLALDGVSAVIEPRPGRSNAILSMTSPLAFTAEYPASQLRFVMANAVVSFGGRVRLGKGMMPTTFEARGETMRVSAAIVGVALSEPLEVPCRDLSLREGNQVSMAVPVIDPAFPSVGTGAGAFPLYINPREQDPLFVRYAGAWQVRQQQASSGWVLLEASWSDGTLLRGWTRSSNIARGSPTSGLWSEIEEHRILPSLGLHEPTLVPMTLRRGAKLAASPGGFVWATASEALSVEVDPAEDAGWLRIGSIGGKVRNADRHPQLSRLWARQADLVAAPAPAGGGPAPSEVTPPAR
jgi:hypothetical protein